VGVDAVGSGSTRFSSWSKTTTSGAAFATIVASARSAVTARPLGRRSVNPSRRRSSSLGSRPASHVSAARLLAPSANGALKNSSSQPVSSRASSRSKWSSARWTRSSRSLAPIERAFSRKAEGNFGLSPLTSARADPTATSSWLYD
jgi:hypothetical protein